MNSAQYAPVLITGMHRSGTSLVAQLLHREGLWLGPTDRLLPPGEGNPNGFWENKNMDAAAEEALTALSGEWDFLLPPMPEGYAGSADLENARALALQAIQSLSAEEPWGWKDPRASIIIPFWKHLIPNLRVIVVLRHPLEVARSLLKRVEGSHHLAMHLWLQYARRILEDTSPNERLVTHYDSYFINPGAEMDRINRWLGLEPDSATLAAARQAIIASTRHESVRSDELLPYDVAQVYQRLCSEAGDTFTSAVASGKLIFSKAGAHPPELPPETVSKEAMEQAQAAFDEGNKHIEDNQTVMAISRLHAATLLNPHFGEAHNDLGVMLMQSSETATAKVHFKIALDIDPHDEAATSNLAAAYVDLGLMEEAIKLYLAFLEQKPDNINTLAWLAAVADETGSGSMAEQYARRILEIDASNAEAKQIISRLEAGNR